jgi:hypothetical protein
MTSMASVSLEQKKLDQLKQQLFGKSDSTPYKITGKQFKESLTAGRSSTTTLESTNLKSDLLRIAILSSAAIVIQFSLFFANHNGLLKLY